MDKWGRHSDCSDEVFPFIAAIIYFSFPQPPLSFPHSKILYIICIGVYYMQNPSFLLRKMSAFPKNVSYLHGEETMGWFDEKKGIKKIGIK